MTQQPTSILAFYEKVLPELNQKQNEVFRTLYCSEEPLTNMELAVKMGWSINRVTPRVLELRLRKLVTVGQIRKCSVTGNRAIAWVAIDGTRS